MRRNRIIIILFGALLLLIPTLISATSQRAGTFYLPSDSLRLIGEVNIVGVVPLAKEINQRSQQGRDVTILINSPGGDVLAGSILVGAIRQAQHRGSKVTCVVSMIAASMAFVTLAYCDERVSLNETILLFHPMAVTPNQGTRLTEKAAAALSEQMQLLTATLEPSILSALGCSRDFYTKHNDRETYWTGQVFRETFPKFNLRIVQSIDAPEGIDIYSLR